MPGTFTQNFYHAVFSTKQRQYLITPDVESRLYPFIGGIVRDMRCELLAINGMPDHVHVLMAFRPDVSISDLIRHIKSRSSKWVNETFSASGHFSWQAGYGGFTVSSSMLPKVRRYIEKQKEHHKVHDLKSEFLTLLERHKITYVEGDVFG